MSDQPGLFGGKFAPRKSRREQNKDHAPAAGRIVQAYTRYCTRHNVPQPARTDIAIMSQQAMNLLRGGYPEDVVKKWALQIASGYSLYEGHKGMTQLQRFVQQEESDNAEKAHIVRMAEDKAAPPGPVLEALRGAKAFPKAPPPEPRHDYVPRTDDPRTCAVCGDGPRKRGRHTKRLATLKGVKAGPRCYECALSGRIKEMDCRNCAYIQEGARG